MKSFKFKSFRNASLIALLIFSVNPLYAQNSARSVLDTLKVTYFSPLDAKKRDRFAQVLRDKLEHLASTCRFLESLGKPNYMPRYMIEAAQNPLSQKSPNGLVPNYNAKALWDETRLEYLRCR